MRQLIFSLVLLACVHLGDAMAVAQGDSPSRERFGFFDTEMFKVLSESETDNMLISPVSMKLLLGLVSEGAVGDAADEIRLALRLPKERESMRKEFDAWLSLFRMKDAGNDFKLSSHIFVSDSYPVKEEYRSVLKSFYGSDITPVRFGETRETCQAINGWVSQETSNLISSVVREDQIEANSKLMLVSAVYFNGVWVTPFTRDKRLRCFYTSSETCQKTVMMTDTGDYKFGYIDRLDAQALHIPYKGGKYSMLILLPSKRNRIDELSRDIVHVSIRSVLSELTTQEVFVQIPNFEISYEREMTETLKKLKLSKIFNDKVNFSNIFTDSGISLTVDRVFHSTKIKVNEEGTEAAAATGAMFMPLMGGTTTSFVANHPFLFFILDSVGYSVLYAGKLMRPNAPDASKNVGLHASSTMKIPPALMPLSDDASLQKVPLLYTKPSRPKYRSIKSGFSQVKRHHTSSAASSLPANNLYPIGQIEHFLQQQLGYLSGRKSVKEKKGQISQPVRQVKNVHLKEQDDSLMVSPGFDSSKSVMDSWRHHILFFN